MLQKRRLAIASLAVLVVSIVAPSLVQAYNQDARHELEAVYARVDQATKNKDIKTLKSYLSESFKLKRQDGKIINREEALNGLEESLNSFKEIHSSNAAISSLKEEASTTVVDTTQVLKAAVDGPDGKSHELAGTVKSRDTWTHDEHGWIIQSSEDLGQTVTIDGKPM